MTEESTGLHEYLSTSLASALFGMVSRHAGYSFEDLFDENEAPRAAAEEVMHAIKETGINADHLATYAMNSIFRLFVEPDNADRIVQHSTEMLWSILGDPESGGADPPVIYKKAGIAVHLTLLGLLSAVKND
jgi:hypothetical protein